MLRTQVNGTSVVSEAPKTAGPSSYPAPVICDISEKTVALHCHPANLVRAVIALDGVADSVLLVPFDACEAFSLRSEEKLSIDGVITDGAPDTSAWKAKQYDLDGTLRAIEKGETSAVQHTQWLLATSGTTGTPKIVAHSTASLTRTCSKKSKGEMLVWGLLYDPARFAGFQVVLQALLSHSTIIVPSPELDITGKIEYLAESGCNALSATPSLWRKVLMSTAVQKLTLKQITLGGEIVDQRVLNSLARQFPEAVITHIFASTEAGVGFSVKDGKAGFPQSWLVEGVRGVEMHISEHGTLVLKNTFLDQGYLGGGGPIANDDGWIDTGDLVEVIDDRVVFKGRINGAINVGGNKVIPEEVEAEILNVPGVFQVAVMAKSSSIAGSLVQALVVPEKDLTDTSGLVKSIKKHCRKSLPSFKAPAFVRLVDELPVGSAGKIRR